MGRQSKVSARPFLHLQGSPLIDQSPSFSPRKTARCEKPCVSFSVDQSRPIQAFVAGAGDRGTKRRFIDAPAMRSTTIRPEKVKPLRGVQRENNAFFASNGSSSGWVQGVPSFASTTRIVLENPSRTSPGFALVALEQCARPRKHAIIRATFGILAKERGHLREQCLVVLAVPGFIQLELVCIVYLLPDTATGERASSEAPCRPCCKSQTEQNGHACPCNHETQCRSASDR